MNGLLNSFHLNGYTLHFNVQYCLVSKGRLTWFSCNILCRVHRVVCCLCPEHLENKGYYVPTGMCKVHLHTKCKH